jgi:ubiquinone/menaquinone biosynthesis C-methylase UbiE
MDNIKILEGDATDMKKCYDFAKKSYVSIRRNSIQAVTCFFGLNHIKNWKESIRDIHRILIPKGSAFITIYKEYLEKFPVKFVYGWAEKMGIQMIKKEDFLSLARSMGFKTEEIEHRLFYFFKLRK